MAIRNWSFTRLWAVTALIWLAAALLIDITTRGDVASRLFGMAIAYSPAFIAGSWAGTHDEIRDWPFIRLLAIWGFPLAGMAGLGDLLHYAGFIATILLAPAAILTVRWLEFGGRRRVSAVATPAPIRVDPPAPIATPSSGTKIG